MDETLLRDALQSQERGVRNRRRLRLVAAGLVVLATAGAGWQLVALDAVPSWAFVARWWPAATAGVALATAVVLWSRTRRHPAGPAAGPEGRWSRIGGVVTTITAIGALVFTALSLAATRDQIDVARQGQLTDRFTRAVDQLGSEGPANVHRRLGGIYALERIAVDSPRDQATMVEVLSAFVRSSSRRVKGEACPPTPADVTAAFTVLTRRDVGRDPERMVIDLREVCLRDVRVVNGDLTGMSLLGADLTAANLNRTRFGLTTLSNATLVDASLYGADLTDGFVFFEDADLTRAQLDSAELGGADFSGSTMTGVDLRSADLGYADFSGADLTGALHNADTRQGSAKKDSSTVGAWW
ncbi:pentapeptide repeat-containing protein [Lentzea sp. CA-135723]|uniref:pentapeptide repeat-containing protein n=1 Tax=Lentzea sp. CA-135723 TaxID=3239950 RepID=UPI003D8E63F7